jgi:hypothetical protein
MRQKVLQENTPMEPRSPSLEPLIPWLKTERPIDWKRQFRREKILELEIGFGYGEFLVQLAQRHRMSWKSASGTANFSFNLPRGTGIATSWASN